jgi:hypothetical protein
MSEMLDLKPAINNREVRNVLGSLGEEEFIEEFIKITYVAIVKMREDQSDV